MNDLVVNLVPKFKSPTLDLYIDPNCLEMAGMFIFSLEHTTGEV